MCAERNTGPTGRLSLLLLLPLLLFLLALPLTACGSRVELFSAASEGEANEILSVLLDGKIEARKVAGKAGISISVDSGHVAESLDLLRSKGLPRERFDGMGKIFRKEGLISSPLEERARYVHALSQELTNTLSQVDGVLIARVHVVLPEYGGVGQTSTQSTAGVFIKHQPEYKLEILKPQIRDLVTHAIPGLTDDRVSIVFVSAQPSAAEVAPLPAADRSGGRRGVGVSTTALVAASILSLLALAGIGAYLLRRRQTQAWRDLANASGHDRPVAEGPP